MPVVNIDDFDPSVVYSGLWGGTNSDISRHDNTSHSTSSTNSEATFIFTGTKVEVRGVIRAASSLRSSYSLDGGKLEFFNAIAAHNLPGGVVFDTPAVFYTSPVLRNSQHNLTITNLYSSTLVIDYFVVTTDDGTESTPSSAVVSSAFTTISTPISSTRLGTNSTVPRSSSVTSPSNTSTISLGSISPSAFGGVSSVILSTAAPPSDNNDTNSATVPNNHDPHKIAAIIGSIGALAAFTLIGITCFWVRRRRKQKERLLLPCIFPTACGSAVAAPAVSFPTVIPIDRPQMPGRPPLPPSYVMNEPLTYDEDIEPPLHPPGWQQHIQNSSHILAPSRQPIKFRTT